jgi:hypothetical protein
VECLSVLLRVCVKIYDVVVGTLRLGVCVALVVLVVLGS